MNEAELKVLIDAIRRALLMVASALEKWLDLHR